jgi:hypothetical protein
MIELTSLEENMQSTTHYSQPRLISLISVEQFLDVVPAGFSLHEIGRIYSSF